jgi:hypothetical protein
MAENASTTPCAATKPQDKQQDAISTLKSRARTLHKQARLGDEQALKRLRKSPEFRKSDDQTVLAGLKRRHCLAAVAREHGFDGWSHATGIINGGTVADGAGFGTTLYPKGCGGHSNIWSATYDEARQIRADHGGFLLAYKNQFLVVDEHFIRTMGLDPDDADFDLIGRDWARPANREARTRLYGKLLA